MGKISYLCYMKIRKYQLQFIIIDTDQLSMGMLVSVSRDITNFQPKPSDSTSKQVYPELGQIMNIQDDERLGVIYNVYEYITGEYNNYIGEKLLAISPVLVSDDIISSNSIFYINGYLHICREPVNSSGFLRDINGLLYQGNLCKLVIARPYELAYIVNDGPPHDRNYNWKRIDGKLLYLEVLHSNVIPNLVLNGGSVNIILGDDGEVEFFDGKVIIDRYGDYTRLSI